jgi:hypothetical protein
MTKSYRLGLFIILTLILCDCDETTQTSQTSSVQHYKIDGTAKVVETQEEVDQTTNVTTKTNVQQFQQQKFRVGMHNNQALDVQKNMSNNDIGKFIQSQLDAKNRDSNKAQKDAEYERKLDAFIEQYLSTHQVEVVSTEGNKKIEKKMQFIKNNREIFYDPMLMKYVWEKVSIMIERNDLNAEHKCYQLLDEEFLKDDMIDFISIIKKSTWFVFKYSKFMPHWIETIGYITDPEFLAKASKQELIYMHFYIKKIFKIFKKVILGNKKSGNKIKQFFIVFAQVGQELSEYEFSINLLFKHINVENKGEFQEDFSNLLTNQKSILEQITEVRNNNYMEPMDPNLTDEISVLNDMITKMRQGIDLSMGEVEITTVIKTSVIDIKKKIMKKINLILYGSLLEKFSKTKYYGYLVQLLKSLQDLLNAHILDNDKEVETILEAMQLFLIKVEEYLEAIHENDNNYSVDKTIHGELISSAAFFISKVEQTKLPKVLDTQKKFLLFVTRMKLFLLALDRPFKDGDINYDFEDLDFNPQTELSDNLDDLFGEFGDLEKDPQISDSLIDLKKNGDKTLYIIEHNIDTTNTVINPQLKGFFDKIKTAIVNLSNMKSILQPFYARVVDIFTEVEKDFAVVGTVEFLQQLQPFYANLVKLKNSEKDMAQGSLPENVTFGQITYDYPFYRETLHPQIDGIVRHLSFVCSKCSPEVLDRISNRKNSHKNSVVDSSDVSNRLTLIGVPLVPSKKKLVYVVEVLDCENSSIFIKMIPRTSRRLI